MYEYLCYIDIPTFAARKLRAITRGCCEYLGRLLHKSKMTSFFTNLNLTMTMTAFRRFRMTATPHRNLRLASSCSYRVLTRSDPRYWVAHSSLESLCHFG